MNRRALDELKQQIPLLEYLRTYDWQPARGLSHGRWMGLCPLHNDHKPSFLVDPQKSLFYCYGCGRGGDVIRFAELYHQVNFPQALTLLREWSGLTPLLNAASDFYRMQFNRYNEPVAYLEQRGVHSPEVMEHMRIGYAPGASLRSWLTQLGYPLSFLRSAGLLTRAGYDSYTRRITFPLESNLYGAVSEARSHLTASCPDRKAVCTFGNKSGATRKRFLLKVCSIMQYCGRRAFTTLLVRSEAISMRASFNN
jgi:DNA primase